ncbi:DUF262 domain-containing protein [Streptococcus parauberis]|uniref:DUF262 domain-containing protein n=1 Tax=Streptococcus parauberis TaxID=1348 RepID=UPI000E381A27|nr:DUF262 domain-containing protein [Streptococcus parauberis]RFE01343.1 hypothetical protein ADO06_01255 [Streptococcus parauberis]
MEFNADKILVKDFFSNNRKYIIPRYQREYSWGTEQLEDFYKDVVNNAEFNSNGSKHNDYFFGTIMLVGDMIQHKTALQLVDGQQRITTFTIFLSVLAKVSKKFDDKISNNIWKYVIGSDDDGEEYKILENRTASPFFEERIQLMNPCDVVVENILEGTEQYRINFAYDFLESKLLSDIQKICNETGLEKITVIKGIRDQILNSQLIYICSQTEEDVNNIFENINSKGKKLFTLDLIKNEIFSIEDDKVPMDKAKELWSQIKNNLISTKQYIPVDTFYRHFWISNYGQSKMDDLYKKFLDSISKDEYYNFLLNLRDSSKIYMSIIEFDKSIFKDHSISKADLAFLEQKLNNINNLFGISQSRIFILALIETYLEGKLKFSLLKETVNFIEEFHYSYNAICKLPNNKLENRYGKFARNLRTSENKTMSNLIISDFITDFSELIPEKNKFIEDFSKLSFKKSGPSNIQVQRNLIAKYSIKKYESILNREIDYNANSESIEHIIPEKNDDLTVFSIGNLLLLEEKLNNEAGSLEFKEKLKIYQNSDYKSVKEFIEVYPNSFNNNDIANRAQYIGDKLYSVLYEKL